MAQPPPPNKADAGMEKLFSRLPTLIEQARKGTMAPQATTQLRQLLRDRRPAIEIWFKNNDLPSPFANLPPVINPAIPTPVPSASSSPRPSPGPAATDSGASGTGVKSIPTTAAGQNPSSTPAGAAPHIDQNNVRPPAPRPATTQPRPPMSGQVLPQVRPNLQPTAPPLARPANVGIPGAASVRPPPSTASAARPPPGVRPPAARPPPSGASTTVTPGSSTGAPPTRTGTPSSTASTANVPKVTSWTDVFNMTAEQRRAWFDAVPGSEATYNKILEDARKKHMAMRQGDGTGSRQGSPAPSAPGSRGSSPAPTGGPGSPAQVNAGNTGNATAQTTAANLASATRAIRPVNQNMPLPNLAIPPGARRGSATVGGTDPANATTAATAVPENRPPAGIHSLSQEKIRFYMSLSDAQGQVLPPDQKQLWLWLKKLIAETKQQSANKQAAQTQQQRTSGPVRPGGGTMTPGPYSGFRIPPAPGGLSMSNLNEEILKLYTGGKAPTMQQLRELCMRGGMNWSVQMENLMAPYASDRPKQQGSGVKLDPIEIPPTPGSGPGVGTWTAPKTTKEHIHENVRKVVEQETGCVIDDDLVSMFEDLAGDLFQEVLAGGVVLASHKSRQDHILEVRDVARISRQAIGITIPGFGLEQAMIGKRKALPSKMSERHLKKLRAVQQAKDRDAGRIH
ncbi:hypothetical protein QFC22_005544 [Naganishia vaughanmartiniae]|uniref:Uncharacterized protein n=1 Tax=Naganishia vaughanmartiniae TaxID=1424756 RepID=A0ACC2WSB9_9TREE|nr:hypothetical protein QFC22_005544 [Naganishia vaughanmartiniae]